ncbi:MAG: hypothetical protein HOA17_07055 [Candidatus Melainabacteria bacterium]|jgi:hypothetical protein|nr:hypothetical protein [Candidatus Melainabacteria bacterium]
MLLYFDLLEQNLISLAPDFRQAQANKLPQTKALEIPKFARKQLTNFRRIGDSLAKIGNPSSITADDLKVVTDLYQLFSSLSKQILQVDEVRTYIEKHCQKQHFDKNAQTFMYLINQQLARVQRVDAGVEIDFDITNLPEQNFELAGKQYQIAFAGLTAVFRKEFDHELADLALNITPRFKITDQQQTNDFVISVDLNDDFQPSHVDYNEIEQGENKIRLAYLIPPTNDTYRGSLLSCETEPTSHTDMVSRN